MTKLHMQVQGEAQEGMRGKGVYVGMGNDKNSKCKRREVQGVSGTCEYGL